MRINKIFILRFSPEIYKTKKKRRKITQLSTPIYIFSVKQVSWVRRKPGETGLELLTVGLQTYSADARYKIEFQYPNNWKLKIESVIKEDEGTYECQISTYPPRVIQKNIFVIGKYIFIWTNVVRTISCSSNKNTFVRFYLFVITFRSIRCMLFVVVLLSFWLQSP